MVAGEAACSWGVTMATNGRAMRERIAARAIPAGAVGVWWLGQASLVLKLAERTIYVDPYLGPGERRLVPPAFAPDQVTDADLVLLTHDHSDHIDPATLPGLALASPGARFVTPRPTVDRVAELIGDDVRIVAATAGEALDLDGLTLTPIAAKHEAFDEDSGLGFPYLGYVIQADGLTIYNAGDTIPYPGLVESLRDFAIDLAFIPINGRDFFRTSAGVLGNCDYREAAELAALLAVDTVVPVHYGMFAGNTVPPGHFVSYLAERAPGINAHIMGRYSAFVYQRP